MKNLTLKLGLLVAFCFAFVIGATAQSTTPTNATVNNNGTGKTYVVVSNSGTGTLSLGAVSGGGYLFNLGVTATLANASGTTAGNILLQSSMDSTNWTNVNYIASSSYPYYTADTFKTSATNLVYHFKVTDASSKYYRLNYLGSGTHSDTLRAKFLIQARR